MIEDISDIDSDILTDKMGHEELEPPTHFAIKTLPSVNERMSEETLEDVHAFTELKNVIRQIGSSASGSGLGTTSSNSSLTSLSREGSITGGSYMGDPGHLLETLEEFEEEGSDDGSGNDDDHDEGGEATNCVECGNDSEKLDDKKKLALLKKKKDTINV